MEADRISWCFINPKDGTEMVLVPGGWFWMGSGDEDTDSYDDEKPVHLHYLKPFYLGIFCITVGQFRQFAGETGHDAGEDWQKDPETHPVRYVNWNDAKAYCQWAGLRLPTEAEWELGARGWGRLKFPWGMDWENGNRVCWSYRKGSDGETASVFSHPDGVSPLGTFQQIGNLWEWCEDYYDEDVYRRYSSGSFAPSAEGDLRSLRGGSWNNAMAKRLRAACRGNSSAGHRQNFVGFRAAMSVAIDQPAEG